MEYSFDWIIFVGAGIFLFYFFNKKVGPVKKMQQEQQQAYEENRIKYRTLSSVQFDQVLDDQLYQAVLFHILAKEDKLYEDDEIKGTLNDHLTHGELIVYTIHQVKSAMEGGNGSIHTFFISEPHCTYRPYVKEAFNEIDCLEIQELMEAAERLAVKVENDEEFELDNDSKYGNYNFAELTTELLSLFQAPDFTVKIAKYIRDNKNDFIDMEVMRDE